MSGVASGGTHSEEKIVDDFKFKSLVLRLLLHVMLRQRGMGGVAGGTEKLREEVNDYCRTDFSEETKT